MMKQMTLCCGVALLAALVGSGKTNYVDGAMSDYTGHDGSTPARAVRTIQEGVDLASSGDVVLVAPGVYDQGGGVDQDAVLNRVLVKDKTLTILSSGGRDVTHIVGRHDWEDPNGTKGLGKDAVRCVCLYGAEGSIVQGFTIRDGATRHYQPSGDYVRAAAGGVLCLTANRNWTKLDYVVDCVISNCVGIRGGAFRGGTAVRCLISNNDTIKGATAGRDSRFWNCLIANGGGTGQVIYGSDAVVNCTIVNNDGTGCEEGSVYNCVVFGNSNKGEQNLASSCRLVRTVTREVFKCKSADVHSLTNCQSYQLLAPLYGDYRVLKGSETETLGAGEVIGEVLAQFPLPAGVDAYVDYFGRPIPKSGAIAAGCIQEAVTPQGGGIIFVDRYSILANGVQNYGKELYAFAETFPTQFVVQALNKANPPIFSFRTNDNIAFPTMDDKLFIIPPASPTEVKTNDVLKANLMLYVDPVKGSDDTTDGTNPETPFKTLQAAHQQVDSRTVIRAAAGEYRDGGNLGGGVMNRLFLSRHARVLGAGAGKSFICGHPDPSTGGTGPNARRCIFASKDNICAVQGFTLTDGYTDESGTSDGAAYHGGGVNVDGNNNYLVRVLDCTITNCWSCRGGALYSGSAERCHIVDCHGPKGLCRYARFISCVFDHQTPPSGYTGGDNYMGKAYGCTFIGRSTSEILAAGDGTELYNCIILNQSKLPEASSIPATGSFAWNVPDFKKKTGITLADPYLANLTTDNYHPTTVSPCIGGGTFIDLGTVNMCDYEGNPLVFTGGNPTAGAFQRTVRAVEVGTVGGLTSTPSGICGPEDDGTLTLTFSEAANRHVSGVLVDGEKVPFARGQTSVVLDIPSDATATVPVKPYVYWYVNANTDATGGKVVGDDANDGVTAETPKRTLEGIFTTGYLMSGDEVHAAAGTYGEGTMRQTAKILNADSGEFNPARAVVPAGVTLVGDEGSAKTFVVGADAPSPDGYGCGVGATRCVVLMEGACLKGLTLTGGRTGNVNSEDDNNAGGGLLGCSDQSVVEDCVISNCVAYRGGAGYCSYSKDGSEAVLVKRSRILANKAIGHNPCVRYARYVDCLIDDNKGNNTISCLFGVENCTFGPGNTKLDGGETSLLEEILLRDARNCILCGNVSRIAATNCLYTGTVAAGFSGEGNRKVTMEELALDADLVPIIGESVAIDAGAERTLAADLDCRGGQRVYNGRIDVGAIEADWRPTYAEAIGGGVCVDAVSPEVTLADGRVRLTDGATLLGRWPAPVGKAHYAVPVSATGAGTLTGTFADPVSGYALTESLTDGEETYRFKLRDTALDLAFSFAGEGHGDLAGFSQAVPGFLLFVR